MSTSTGSNETTTVDFLPWSAIDWDESSPFPIKHTSVFMPKSIAILQTKRLYGPICQVLHKILIQHSNFLHSFISPWHFAPTETFSWSHNWLTLGSLNSLCIAVLFCCWKVQLSSAFFSAGTACVHRFLPHFSTEAQRTHVTVATIHGQEISYGKSTYHIIILQLSASHSRYLRFKVNLKTSIL